MKKILSFVLVILILVSSMTINVFADENNSTKIKLGDVFVNVPYNENDIIVEYEKNEIEIRAIIKDKHTGEILDIHGEYIQPLDKLPQSIIEQFPDELKTRANSLKESNDINMVSSQGDFFVKVVYNDKVFGSIVARLYCEFEYYSEYNYRNVTKIVDTYWREASSGTFKIERETSNATVSEDKTGVTVWGGCNIVLTVTKDTSASIGIPAVFEFSHEVGETQYYRTTIDDFRYSYSIY
ncbi:hypothetical protein JYG23_01850 [Sedimentibacter sp. zth1]|uniref:hypothetical protein n=1 Tax=Sedimentibacter sp. zth1 TaxID=2816908 RepID=UPI001A9190C8|nr:hypothetical protein [Sedimentibacter sp. zth1]QSX06230.1 hypothetical protein JYG23_01850 [Sedimentibacter sp. zth1]